MADGPRPRDAARPAGAHLWARFKLGAVAAIRPYPSLMLPYASISGRSAQRVRATTDIVIEGFERSGNTFAVAAFALAQRRPVSIAHHLHASAQVIYAARRRIPSLVLLRDADEALTSFLLFHPASTPRQAMWTWLRFHAPLIRYRDRLLLARFTTVTSDFELVIDTVNEKFGTSFEPFRHTEENVAACFALMEEQQRSKRPHAWMEETVGRPSAWREHKKDVARARLEEAPASLRRRVSETYAALANVADV